LVIRVPTTSGEGAADAVDDIILKNNTTVTNAKK
jgi:hypothetical protein